MKGKNLNLTSDPGDTAGGRPASSAQQSASEADPSSGRPFVGVRFDCCEVYTRVYINDDKTAYEGRCPKCSKQVRLAIGPGGTDARFFSVR